MSENLSPKEAEELFVNQAAHLFLAFAGIKPLPKPKANPLLPDDLLPPIKRKSS